MGINLLKVGVQRPFFQFLHVCRLDSKSLVFSWEQKRFPLGRKESSVFVCRARLWKIRGWDIGCVARDTKPEPAAILFHVRGPWASRSRVLYTYRENIKISTVTRGLCRSYIGQKKAFHRQTTDHYRRDNKKRQLEICCTDWGGCIGTTSALKNPTVSQDLSRFCRSFF